MTSDAPSFAATREGEELIRRAREVYKEAYVPYSHYPVGAAALFSSQSESISLSGDKKTCVAAFADHPTGMVAAPAEFSLSRRIYSGCNVENASYGLTVCAERNAIFQAVAQGQRVLQGIAIAVPGDGFPAPCGACRQVMREFTEDCPVILVNGRGETKETSLKALLPNAFGPEFL
ncbi:MAG: cytidine deaminase [Desulfitobacteriaceae bacterium]|nr:cytidine deaminase [Desulfitobacteriaceae bacterium]MDI6878610.1 cytidine deaminase [Desulfitobacteriaceae bacterium]MDI6914879.1 cytidine deaminase [Desulfitobacteriaceae bacterium]